ncbi:WD40-repeat-containing domain protein [Spinellus fusiger]|nr:WD40-repeat-containing domain protein [Spinellus fusiger]
MSFGKQKKEKDISIDFEKTKREDRLSTKDQQVFTGTDLPTTKPHTTNKEDIEEDQEDQEDDDDDDDDDEEDEAEAEAKRLPITHEIRLRDHSRTVSALTLDPSGSRLITGSYDYEVKFWDFSGMDKSFRPFRTIEPCAGHQVHEVLYSITGDSFLAITGSARAKLYDRDGLELCEYMKGDPYIRDLRHTDGHVGALTGGAWHPTDRSAFVTSSQDGTIRLWDVDTKRRQSAVIPYKSRERGGRSSATAVAYSSDGKTVVGAFQDGTLNLWDIGSSYLRPTLSVSDAHQKHSETSSIVFSRNGHTMVTRGGDDSVKLWDIRNIKKPVRAAYNLEVINPQANIIFSPDEQLILTGTSVPKGEGYGQLVMLDSETLEIKNTTNVNQSSVVKVLWHPRINQIVTGSADGTVTVFYSPTRSTKGAKLCVVKETKKRAIDDYEVDRPIITPHALPMFRDDEPRSSKRKREKLRKDPKVSHRPEMPVNGPGKGGRVGLNEQQAVIAGFSKDTTRDEDPREALLRYADAAEKDPMWVNNVYKSTQPKPVFALEEDSE